MFLPTARLARSLSALTLAAAAFAPALDAQQVWVPLDTGMPPGTPANIVYDQGASSAADSFFDVFVYGYWQEEIQPGDGNTYQQLTVPGLGRLGQSGAPDLPVARLNLAVSTGAAQTVLASLTDLDPHNVSLLPLPYGIQETDEVVDPSADPGPGDPDGSPEMFYRDELIYGATGSFPGSSASGAADVGTRFGSIPAASPEVYPASWDPNTGVLSISGHLRVHYAAPGIASNQPAMTLDRASLAAATFNNWPGQAGSFQANTQTYQGRYLIVTPAEYLVTLEPFIQKKKSLGFIVSTLTLESLAFVTCGNLRGAMDDWYQAGNPAFDHYALLVGDQQVIPMCPSPTADIQMGDDMYGSPGDGDLDEEIYVGRLSVDSASDLAIQTNKIIRYTEDQKGDHYDEVLLVAHKEGAPGKYEGAHESVANANYAVTPNFEKRYGSQVGNANPVIVNSIENGKGIVAYRGHGSTYTWWDWNFFGQNFHKNDVLTLASYTNTNVVWAFNCWNNNLIGASDTVDSLGETWLEDPNSGAVAHYGSAEISSTKENHELDRRMFEAIFDKGITRHGQAIAWAEAKMKEAQPGLNSWMYLLLGDPSMRIRREDPVSMLLPLPESVETCVGPSCGFDIAVTDEQGSPLPGVLVSVFQDGPSGGPDGFQANAYTGSNGNAHFDSAPMDIVGDLTVVASDGIGNVVSGSVGVTDTVWTNFGGAFPGVDGEPQLLPGGPLQGGSVATLDLSNGAQSAQALLFFSYSSVPVQLKCLTLQAFPIAATFDLVTDAQGEITMASLWPAGLPAGLEFWFQIAIADQASPCGLSISNAVRGMTP